MTGYRAAAFTSLQQVQVRCYGLNASIARVALVFCSLVLLFGHQAGAQIPAGSPAGIGTSLTRLFGDITAFSAKADARVFDKDDQQYLSTPMNFALLDGRIRVDLDLTLMTNRDMPQTMSASLKQMGMAKVISITRPDKKLTYIVYPDQKAYMSLPLSQEEAEAAAKAPKIEKTPLGKETIDGHPCDKTKILMTDDKGHVIEATTWNASDLKNFPVQIKAKEKDNTLLMHFSQIQVARPDSKQFDAPADFTQYTNSTDMMQAMVKKMMGGEPDKK